MREYSVDQSRYVIRDSVHTRLGRISRFSTLALELRAHGPLCHKVTNMNPKRTMHGEHWSPCIVRRAGHDKQYPDLQPCPTDDARTAEKPVGRAPKKGYCTLWTSYVKGCGRNSDRPLAMAASRPCACPLHGCLRHGTTVPTGWVPAHTSSQGTRPGLMSNA